MSSKQSAKQILTESLITTWTLSPRPLHSRCSSGHSVLIWKYAVFASSSESFECLSETEEPINTFSHCSNTKSTEQRKRKKRESSCTLQYLQHFQYLHRLRIGATINKTNLCHYHRQSHSLRSPDCCLLRVN